MKRNAINLGIVTSAVNRNAINLGIVTKSAMSPCPRVGILVPHTYVLQGALSPPTRDNQPKQLVGGGHTSSRSGAYATPTACRPTAYSSVFKSACPRAYSYAYDDRSSTFTCHSAAGYTIAFCLPPSGLHDSDANPLVSPPANGQSTSGGSVGAADSTPPPSPTVGNGIGSANQAPPSTDNGGGGTTGQAPPATDNGGDGATGQAPPATGNGGVGSTNLQPPPTDNDGAGGSYQQPWMTMSLASTLHDQLWLLLPLPAVLLFVL
ncbi:unnamed protein product [Miscanthus lutarioriparius]|uniref:Uncharacterized protein n=1 Tax=Miscanthus lutarioriparius TaxID=422564 RepID=A0A811R3Y1_9POAL|nr:unnamed protein product [Miscanthus lutarioriparius]